MTRNVFVPRILRDPTRNVFVQRILRDPARYAPTIVERARIIAAEEALALPTPVVHLTPSHPPEPEEQVIVMNALETCNACDISQADPASPGGYCADCEADAREQGCSTCGSTETVELNDGGDGGPEQSITICANCGSDEG